MVDYCAESHQKVRYRSNKISRYRINDGLKKVYLHQHLGNNDDHFVQLTKNYALEMSSSVNENNLDFIALSNEGFYLSCNSKLHGTYASLPFGRKNTLFISVDGICLIASLMSLIDLATLHDDYLPHYARLYDYIDHHNDGPLIHSALQYE